MIQHYRIQITYKIPVNRVSNFLNSVLPFAKFVETHANGGNYKDLSHKNQWKRLDLIIKLLGVLKEMRSSDLFRYCKRNGYNMVYKTFQRDILRLNTMEKISVNLKPDEEYGGRTNHIKLITKEGEVFK